MHLDVLGRMSSVSRSYFFPNISILYQQNILEEYQHVWDVLVYNNKSLIRPCEQELVKLDKEELIECYLHQFVRSRFSILDYSIKQKEKKYVPSVLLHLIYLFCITGQEEKMKVVQLELNKVLHTMTEGERYDIFERYLSQRLKVKSSLTEIDMLTGQIDTQHQVPMKLIYLNILCAKIKDEGCKECLQQNVDYLVSNIEREIGSIPFKFLEKGNTKLISCTMLLCLLNLNIYKTTTQVIIQNKEATASSSVGYSFMASKVNNILQNILSTLSEDDIFTVFINYLKKRKAMKTVLTADDLCTGKIELYHELMSELCNIENLCNENYYKTEEDFLQTNNDLIHAQIEKLVDWNKTKTKYISLLGLSQLEISGQTTSPIKNNLSQMLLALKTDCQDYINENALVFVSMVDTVVTSNNVQLLTNLCDVLLCIPFNEHHFHDVTGAINKLIKYYAKQVVINKKICEWIILLGHRLLKDIKHTLDIQNHSTAAEILKDFQKFVNFLGDLFTKAIRVGITFDFLINAFRTEHYHFNENEHCEYCGYETFTTEFSIKKTAEDKRLKELWKAKLTCKLKTMQISRYLKKNSENFDENKTFEICLRYIFEKPHLNFISAFEAEVKKDHLDATTLQDRIKAILIIDQMVKKFQLSEMLVLLMMLLIAGTSNGHHKSAKLKKYLTLKYEYHMASLYLLWCSGDIEVHPGPSLNKKLLAHDSSIERRWTQNISPKILVLLQEHEQPKYKPTKKVRKDREIRDHFKALFKTCLEEKVHVPKMYLAEINAWETMEYHLLYKLFVYRCEIEAIIASIKDFVNFEGSTKDLTDINVSFNTELKTNEIEMILGKDQRPTDQSQLMVYITRHIAGISIKCAYGKDPDAKCDGLWDLPLENWPKDIILFDPNNRGKYSKKYPAQKLISDQELVDNLITLPQVTIPQKYTKIVEAYKLMRKSKTKHNKAELCSIFKRTTSLEKIDYALKNLSENGIFTEEVHDILTKWWTTGVVEAEDNQTHSLENMDDAKKIERPHVLIYIHTKSITFTVKPTRPNSSQVSYNFPFKDELVPLKTMKLSTQPEDNPGDNQTDLFIIPQATMNILNSIITFDPNSQAMFESEIKLQCKTSTQDLASKSNTHLNQTTSSALEFNQSNQNIAISGQPVPILCTHNQSTTNSDDLGHLYLRATKDSKNLAFQNLVSPTSDIGLSDSTSSVNSKGGNEERDQNNTLNERQDLTTDSDYSSDSSNNCVSKTNLKKRKCIEEDRIEMKKRKIPSLKEDKKQSETTIHRKNDSSMDNSTTSNKDMELLLDYLDIDLNSFDIDEKTFDVELNALDNDDKNLEICDKDGNLMNDETQMSNKNTNVSAYKTNVSSDLEMFLQEMIYGESEKMLQMKSYLSDV